jgi:hypothetical protein
MEKMLTLTIAETKWGASGGNYGEGREEQRTLNDATIKALPIPAKGAKFYALSGRKIQGDARELRFTPGTSGLRSALRSLSVTRLGLLGCLALTAHP